MKKTIFFSALLLSFIVVGTGLAADSDRKFEPGKREKVERDDKTKQRCPEMKSAYRSLRSALGYLNKATNDYQGHRAAAVKKIEEAMKEVDDGMRKHRCK